LDHQTKISRILFMGRRHHRFSGVESNVTNEQQTSLPTNKKRYPQCVHLGLSSP